MPGYRQLSSHLSGAAAERVREAESLVRDGNFMTAARVLEDVLEDTLRSSGSCPAWICGRLATLYRTLKRYDDEVLLLERHRDLHVSDDARARFAARLSKARTLADRHRPLDSGALQGVRESRTRSRYARSGRHQHAHIDDQ